MKRAAQVRELKNKIERQKPAKSIKKDHHHSAIHEVCKKKNTKKDTLVFCGDQGRQLKRYL